MAITTANAKMSEEYYNPDVKALQGGYKAATDKVWAWLADLYNNTRPNNSVNYYLMLTERAVRQHTTMPYEIYQSLQEAITLRSLVAEDFERNNGYSAEQREKHAYCIKKLREIEQMFQSNGLVEPEEQPTPAPAETATATATTRPASVPPCSGPRSRQSRTDSFSSDSSAPTSFYSSASPSSSSSQESLPAQQEARRSYVPPGRGSHPNRERSPEDKQSKQDRIRNSSWR